MNGQLLELMSVGHPKLRAVCAIAEKHGLCAKLTGAGGGGCAFALIPNGKKSSRFQGGRVVWLIQLVVDVPSRLYLTVRDFRHNKLGCALVHNPLLCA